MLGGISRLNMMEHIHLAGEDEDDLYSGYNDYNATLDTEVSFEFINMDKSWFCCIELVQFQM